MIHSLNVQTAGSLAVATAILASEIGPLYLDAYPGSAFAWYLHLELLGAFREAGLQSSPLQFLFGSGAVACGCSAMGAILLCRISRFRFGVALFANLAFGVTLALSWTWATSGPAARTASLTTMSWPAVDGGSLLLAALVIASFVACGLSHASFAALIAAENARRQGRRLGRV